jgi:hypothetical protein
MVQNGLDRAYEDTREIVAINARKLSWFCQKVNTDSSKVRQSSCLNAGGPRDLN